MLGKTEGRRKRGQQMIGWHHQLNGHESVQTLGDSEGQGSLACVHGVTESDTTEQLNNKQQWIIPTENGLYQCISVDAILGLNKQKIYKRNVGTTGTISI